MLIKHVHAVNVCYFLFMEIMLGWLCCNRTLCNGCFLCFTGFHSSYPEDVQCDASPVDLFHSCLPTFGCYVTINYFFYLSCKFFFLNMGRVVLIGSKWTTPHDFKRLRLSVFARNSHRLVDLCKSNFNSFTVFNLVGRNEHLILLSFKCLSF